MFHIDARTPELAKKHARRKYGEPISCRKMDALSSLASIENLKLEQSPFYGVGSPYQNAVAMDEMVWQKQKRTKRRNNLGKDKKDY